MMVLQYFQLIGNIKIQGYRNGSKQQLESLASPVKGSVLDDWVSGIPDHVNKGQKSKLWKT